MKALKRALALSLAVFVLGTMIVSAAAPNVRPATAVVNGNESEWQVTPLTSANPDWFASTCAPAGTNCATPSGDLFLRFDCTTKTLYVLELARAGSTFTMHDASNTWIKISGVSGNVIQDGTPYDTNTSPNMIRDLTDGKGYEAGLDKVGKNNAGPAFAPGTNYTINFHANINGTTSGSDDILVTIPSCQASAVTVSSISAGSTDTGINFAVLALGGAGLVVLGGLVFFTARKR